MTSLLTADDLAMERAAQDADLPDTCTILLPTTTRTSTGGYVDTNTTVATGVLCRFRVIQPGQRGLHGEMVVGEPVYVLTLAYSQALTTLNRVSINNVVYNVQSVNAGESERTATRATLIPLKTKPL